MADWWWKADYFETCNCAYGCPCNLNSMPTHGTCEAIDCWRITEGAMADVRLDGLKLAVVVAWPNAIFQGNGKAVIYVGDEANQAQREALTKIGTGKAGPGGPFEIFASTYSEPPEVICGPLQLHREGKKATIRIGNIAKADLGPIIAAMDGAEADVTMVMPDGFIWKNGEMVNTETCEVNAKGISFKFNNSSAFLSQVEYNV
jgi:hypothetical protein